MWFYEVEDIFLLIANSIRPCEVSLQYAGQQGGPPHIKCWESLVHFRRITPPAIFFGNLDIASNGIFLQGGLLIKKKQSHTTSAFKKLLFSTTSGFDYFTFTTSIAAHTAARRSSPGQGWAGWRSYVVAVRVVRRVGQKVGPARTLWSTARARIIRPVPQYWIH